MPFSEDTQPNCKFDMAANKGHAVGMLIDLVGAPTGSGDS